MADKVEEKKSGSEKPEEKADLITRVKSDAIPKTLTQWFKKNRMPIAHYILGLVPSGYSIPVKMITTLLPTLGTILAIISPHGMIWDLVDDTIFQELPEALEEAQKEGESLYSTQVAKLDDTEQAKLKQATDANDELQRYRALMAAVRRMKKDSEFEKFHIWFGKLDATNVAKLLQLVSVTSPIDNNNLVMLGSRELEREMAGIKTPVKALAWNYITLRLSIRRDDAVQKRVNELFAIVKEQDEKNFKANEQKFYKAVLARFRDFKEFKDLLELEDEVILEFLGLKPVQNPWANTFKWIEENMKEERFNESWAKAKRFFEQFKNHPLGKKIVNKAGEVNKEAEKIFKPSSPFRKKLTSLKIKQKTQLRKLK